MSGTQPDLSIDAPVRAKVLREGTSAHAVIVEARVGAALNLHGERNWTLQIRVRFDDGETTDVTCECFDLGVHVTGPVSGLEPYPFATGVVLPVKYDADDRSKVDIDRPKLIADTIAAYDLHRALKIAAADKGFAPLIEGASS
jgi:hypothetical protein